MFPRSRSATLTCRFELHNDGYNCRMMGEFSEKDMTVTYISGGHNHGKDNSRVDVLYVPTTTKYLPSGFCSSFQNVNKFDMKPADLREISRKIFVKCDKLKTVHIYSTLISSLPEDVFNDLISLETLDMSKNRIEYLPAKLFENNLKLISISFNANLLRFINVKLPTMLQKAVFNNNQCISKDFPTLNQSLSSFEADLREKCTQEQSTILRIKSLQDEIDLQKLKVEKLQTESKNLTESDKKSKSDFDLCKIEKSEKEKTLHNLTVINENLITQMLNMKIESGKKAEEIKMLTSNHTDLEVKVIGLFSNITSMTILQTQSEIELSSKKKELEKCSVDSRNLTALYRNLNGEILVRRNENEKLKEHLMALVQSNAKLMSERKVSNEKLRNVEDENKQMQKKVENFIELNKDLEVKGLDLEMNLTATMGNCSSEIEDLQSNLKTSLKQLNETNLQLALSKKEKKDFTGGLVEDFKSMKITQNLLIALLIFVSAGWITSAFLYIRKTEASSADQVCLSSLIDNEE